ncbi:hypothetical protein [Halomicrococcus sp. NG-SE-24]|uniref:hypothetical protein n=1 Tax=Halomicrococcus sp. NG-SE-24 TaxID=3436928 RepID=UPI003D965B75
MVNATISPIHRGHIRTDINHIVEGYRLGSSAEPNPDAPMDEGIVYNLVIDHPEATILWDTGSHPDAGNGHWPAPLYKLSRASASGRDPEGEARQQV